MTVTHELRYQPRTMPMDVLSPPSSRGSSTPRRPIQLVTGPADDALLLVNDARPPPIKYIGVPRLRPLHTPPLSPPRAQSPSLASSVASTADEEDNDPPTALNRLNDFHFPQHSGRSQSAPRVYYRQPDPEEGQIYFEVPALKRRTKRARSDNTGHRLYRTDTMASAAGSSASGKGSGGRLQRKILIMGSRSVGKSSLTTQYVEPNSFADSYYPTIEAVHSKEIVHEGITYDCEIIDTAGQDEYSLFNHKYAVGIHGYVLVYSIASRQSFDMISILHDKITEFQGVNKVCCVVVGQKSDLGDARQVKTEEGQALAKKLGASFIETSAKSNIHINDVFNLLMGDMRKVYNPPEEKKKQSWWQSWVGGGK